VDLAGVTPIALDITDPASVAAAAQAASGVAILVNNAGSSTGSSLLTGDMAAIRREMDTHFFGTLAVTRAFAPQLAAQGSSAVLNILSALSWLSSPRSVRGFPRRSIEHGHWPGETALGRSTGNTPPPTSQGCSGASANTTGPPPCTRSARQQQPNSSEP
jgi:NAD(P)-dependent dehydrogenase (short-subunit alcohol dehydrogenase family)